MEPEQKDLQMYNEKIKNPAMILSSGFLLIHIMMIIMFYAYHVTPMVIVNVFSILFYICTFLMIKHRHLVLYVITVYFEVMIHMFLAVLFTGWENGFQICMIGMVILGFFSEYSARSVSSASVSGISLGLIGLAFYLNSFTISHLCTAKYPLPSYLSYVLQIIMGFTVFGIIMYFLNMFIKITFRSERDLSFLVEHDKLTGLYSRYYMNDFLARFEKESDKSGSWIAIADIDDFKRINDSYGHNCGDYVLKTVSSLLAKELGDSTVCRWGGEEFLVFERSDLRDPFYGKLDNARRAVAEYDFEYQGDPLSVTITIGGAPYEGGHTIEKWVDQADKKLYTGKNSGKDQVVL